MCTLRATIRIGELSAELETVQGKRTDKHLDSTVQKSKAETLKSAGISPRSANRAEQLAEPAARKKVEQYIADQAAAKKPVTITQALRAAASGAAVDVCTCGQRGGEPCGVRPSQYTTDSHFPSVRQFYAVLGRIRGFLRLHTIAYQVLWLTALQHGIEQEIQSLERRARHPEEQPPTLLDMVNVAP